MNSDNSPSTAWRKASYSNGQGSCVEVGHSARMVLVRDTKQDGQATRTVVPFRSEAWAAFTASLK
jgi:hypothetical protein